MSSNASFGSVDWVQFAKEIRRRPAWVLALGTLGLVAGFLAVGFISPVYEASTSILVEPQRIPSDYVKPTVTLDLRDRLATIQQQTMSRENLDRVIDDIDLYPELIVEGEVEAALRAARSALRLEVQRNQVFRVVFSHADPEKAAEAANRIAELFLQENFTSREKQAAITTEFLGSELEETRLKLEEQERLIADFKRKHLGGLPEQRDTLLRSIDTGQNKLEIAMTAADRAESRRLQLQQSLAEAQALPRTSSSVNLSSDQSDDGATAEELRNQLVALLGQYTERHPEVVRTRQMLEAVENAQSSRGASSDSAEVAASSEESALVRQLRQEIENVELELAGLAQEQARVLADIDQQRARLDAMPGVETELLRLTRDYDNVSKSYESMLDKRLQAELAENLEKRQQGEQFRILESAVPPKEPAWPSRNLFLAAGLALGVAAGLGISFLRFQLAPVFSNREDLANALPGTEILGTIPHLIVERQPPPRVLAYKLPFTAAAERRRKESAR